MVPEQGRWLRGLIRVARWRASEAELGDVMEEYAVRRAELALADPRDFQRRSKAPDPRNASRKKSQDAVERMDRHSVRRADVSPQSRIRCRRDDSDRARNRHQYGNLRHSQQRRPAAPADSRLDGARDRPPGFPRRQRPEGPRRKKPCSRCQSTRRIETPPKRSPASWPTPRPGASRSAGRRRRRSRACWSPATTSTSSGSGRRSARDSLRRIAPRRTPRRQSSSAMRSGRACSMPILTSFGKRSPSMARLLRSSAWPLRASTESTSRERRSLSRLCSSRSITRIRSSAG